MHRTLVLTLTVVLVVLLGVIFLVSCSRLAPTGVEPLPLATFTPAPPTPTPVPPLTVNGESFRLVLTEQQLNEQASRAIASGASSPIRNVSVDARPGQLWVTAQVMVAFAPIDAVLLVSAAVENGRLKLALDDVRVAGRSAGPRVRDQVSAYLQPYLAQLASVNDAVFVESVAITDSEVVITGQKR